jgi:uncharacterized damage-inducible protein DinB
MSDRTDPPMQADERTTLTSFLDYFRSTLLEKAADLTDAEARRATCPPSSLNLMGLIRHMAEVERYWFRRVWADDATATPLFHGEVHPTADPDGDIHPSETDTIATAVDAWLTEVEAARDAVARAVSLDDAAAMPPTQYGSVAPSMRWILVHMIEEYARHCGHADLIREAIDGRTGD